MCVGVISFLHDYNDDDDENNNNNKRRLTLQIRAIYYCERLGTDFFPFFYFWHLSLSVLQCNWLNCMCQAC